MDRTKISKATVIVCTIGKFYDILCIKNWINLQYLKAICVDEFDNIISSQSRARNINGMTTEDQMDLIMKKVPQSTQRAFFSATTLAQSKHKASGYFRKYNKKLGESLVILLKETDFTLDSIKQYYVTCESIDDKKEILLDLISQCRIAQCIVFVNHINTVAEIKNFLSEQRIKIPCGVFHGELSSKDREGTLASFISGNIRLLISTDITSRGIDIQSINLVVNFDMPNIRETYVHRAGRAGRFGRKGVVISLLIVNSNLNETEKIHQINEISTGKMNTLPEDIADLL